MVKRQRLGDISDLRIVKDYDRLSDLAANLVAAIIRRSPRAVVGFPTGRSPLGFYKRLAALHRQGLATSRLTAVSLDEYLGVSPDDSISLFGWLRRVALEPLGIPAARALRLPSDAADPQAACKRFTRLLARHGGFDLVVLGLGWNGHVAFNEPGSLRSTSTHIVALQPGTVERNRAYWRDRRRLPRYAMTVGLRSILRAKRIFLLVSGARKAQILAATLRGPITSAIPASQLRLGRLTVIADQAAAKLLTRASKRRRAE